MRGRHAELEDRIPRYNAYITGKGEMVETNENDVSVGASCLVRVESGKFVFHVASVLGSGGLHYGVVLGQT